MCKTNKWWKTLFDHFLDIARVNAFILFEDFRKKHADIIPELQRPDRYGQLDFTTELIRQLADLDVHADVPLVSKKRVFTMHPIIPVMTKERFFFKCYKEKQKEQKTNVKCMGCETCLCFQSDRNCLLSFHEC